MRSIADRDRWLALALLVAALGLAYLVLLHPWWTLPMRDLGTRIEALQQRELRARMQLQQAGEVDRRLRAAQGLEAGSPSFLREERAELATAGLVQRLETVVATASPGNRSCAIVNRSPNVANPGDERFERITVHVRLRCGNPETAAILHALEGGTPRLFVDNLSLLSQGFFATQGRTAGQRDYGLDVEFDLYGFLRPAPGHGAAQGVVDAP